MGPLRFCESSPRCLLSAVCPLNLMIVHFDDWDFLWKDQAWSSVERLGGRVRVRREHARRMETFAFLTFAFTGFRVSALLFFCSIHHVN